MQKIKVAILCGGPSLERGISLNSARSIMDHLSCDSVDVFPVYFNEKKEAFKISKSQLYCNTPSDFDFKLDKEKNFLTKKNLIKFLKEKDICFLAIHGLFGEDGKIQAFLEKNNIPFVGSGSKSCKKAFDKFHANKIIAKNGFFTFPSVVLKIYHNDHKKIVFNFFKKNNIKRAIVKPANGGSSIGVFSVQKKEDALKKAQLIFSKRMDTRVVIEPFAEGKEFTMIILKNHFGIPVSLPPTEIETDYTENQIFDFRRKYLPTRQVSWHCPPRLEKDIIEKIQAQGEQIFSIFEMEDFARFDGWVTKEGKIWFCDFNPISGMEQNSFLFQQASRIGLTHKDILTYILKVSCRRQNINFPNEKKDNDREKEKIRILMGGSNSERQVSLMSGTNVWLKIRKSTKFEATPFMLDTKKNIWKVPYQHCLNHTVEEIAENCKNHRFSKKRFFEFEKRARLRLGLPKDKSKRDFFDPQKISFNEFLKQKSFVFIALHGGDGENGTMQKKLKENKIKHNGSEEKVSSICINKDKTGDFIENLKIKDVNRIPGKVFSLKKIISYGIKDCDIFWESIKKTLDAKTIIVKPKDDGCTTGIAHLHTSKDLLKYLRCVKKKLSAIPKNTLTRQSEIIEMPVDNLSHLLFEKFIETDKIKVSKNLLKYKKNSGWIEITVGVIEKNKKIKAFNPSITVAEGEVLSVEEKFQGGTGINLTPPPKKIVKKRIIENTKKKIENISEKIGIKGYARIDAFLNVKNGKIMVIEINTLPGLTPSTVFYHQALAEKTSIFPKELLEQIIENKN